SVVFYADHPDFQQTNVVGEAIEEGTGGITEGLRTRVVMPFTGSYADNDHVLGHELVHVFQYSVAENGPGGLARLNALPLWLIEGMAGDFSPRPGASPVGRSPPRSAAMIRSRRCGSATPPSATTCRRSSSSLTTPASSRIATARRCGRTSAAAGAHAPAATVNGH